MRLPIAETAGVIFVRCINAGHGDMVSRSPNTSFPEQIRTASGGRGGETPAPFGDRGDMGGEAARAHPRIPSMRSGLFELIEPGGETSSFTPSATAMRCDSPRTQGRFPLRTFRTKSGLNPRSKDHFVSGIPDAANCSRTAVKRWARLSERETPGPDMCNVTFDQNCPEYSLKSQISQQDLENSQLFASRLREERVNVTPKQRDFAELSGVDNTTLSVLENGKQKIRADHLAPLANAGIDILYVVTGRRSGSLLPQTESDLLDAFRKLDPAAQEAVVLMLARMVSGMGDRRPVHDDRIQASIHDKSQDYRHG